MDTVADYEVAVLEDLSGRVRPLPGLYRNTDALVPWTDQPLRSSAVLKLSDGRTLGYDEVGDPQGTPVLYLHGTPDSRLARHPDDSLCVDAGVRLLAVDRPGYGASSPPEAGEPPLDTGRRLASDLVELLDALDIETAALLAWSGGALAALTVAASAGLSERLRELVLVAGVVPREAYEDPVIAKVAPERTSLFELADDMAPAELGEMVAPMLAPFPCDHQLALEHQHERRNETDQAALEQIPGAVQQMAGALVESVRQGTAGVAADVIAQHHRGAVPAPGHIDLPVLLLYGADDQVTPPDLGVWYQHNLPYAELVVIEGAGHVLLLTHWEQLLTRLAGERQ